MTRRNSMKNQLLTLVLEVGRKSFSKTIQHPLFCSHFCTIEFRYKTEHEQYRTTRATRENWVKILQSCLFIATKKKTDNAGVFVEDFFLVFIDVYESLRRTRNCARTKKNCLFCQVFSSMSSRRFLCLVFSLVENVVRVGSRSSAGGFKPFSSFFDSGY